ncbi:MAG: alanine racemase [Cyanobacteria bacterium J06623_5]
MLSWDKTPDLLPMRCARAWVEINLTALENNVRTLRSYLSPTTDLMAVVKADAYGHGAVTVAKAALASGATWLGVATVPEGIELRQAGIEAPILVMGAVNDPAEVRAIARWQLEPTIVNPKQALIFSETLTIDAECSCSQETAQDSAQERPQNSHQVSPQNSLPVHLKLDTGMSRLGFSWQKSVEFARFVKQLAYLEIASVYSHLATADSPDGATMRLQHERFEQAIADLTQAQLRPPRLHLANSAATLADKNLHYDMVRVGLATYGLYPAVHLRPDVGPKNLSRRSGDQANSSMTVSPFFLRPVLEVKARITHIKDISPGDGVSYSHQFVATEPMKIAIVGIGYADGVPRLLSNKLEVIVRGQRVKQIGAITMDQLMLDVSAVPGIQESDVVTLLGTCQNTILSADHWAELTGTISWEILCGFKHRLPRITLSASNSSAYRKPTQHPLSLG